MKVANKSEVIKKSADYSVDMSRVVANLLEEILPVEDDRKFVLAKHIKNYLISVYQLEEKLEQIVEAYNQLAEETNDKNKQTTDVILDSDRKDK